MTRNRETWKAVALVVSVAALAGCKGGPRDVPVRLSPTTGTLEQVRRQIEGTWELVSFEAAGEDGRLVTVASAGRLSYDAFGNFEIDGRILDPASGVPETRLDLKGRAVIDVQNQRLWIEPDSASTGADVIPEGASPERVRYYDLAGDQMTLTVKDAAGTVTARTVWRRAAPRD